ncbi:MAG: hypothetical protein N2V72_07355 [Methanophagales archaeon]|nr:hypothetical protein [Methanophagales archaeon]
MTIIRLLQAPTRMGGKIRYKYKEKDLLRLSEEEMKKMRGSAAKLSVGLVGGSPTIAILSWQCSYTRQWLE